jgi:hypothetical protein
MATVRPDGRSRADASNANGVLDKEGRIINKWKGEGEAFWRRYTLGNEADPFWDNDNPLPRTSAKTPFKNPSITTRDERGLR